MSAPLHVNYETEPTGLYSEIELKQMARGRDVTQAREAFWTRWQARCDRREVLVDKPHLFVANSLSPEDEYTPQSETSQWTPEEAEAFATDFGPQGEQSETGGGAAEDVHAPESVEADAPKGERAGCEEELVYC